MGKPRVLLIGWDGADWKVINKLMAAGEMPNIEKLINAGVMGDMTTLYPPLSPMLWTTIATGKRPFKHGVFGFTEPDPGTGGVRPVTSLSRNTRALWNMLQLQGMHSNVIGWWPSHPVEPINGVMVSEHYKHAVGPLDKPWPVAPGTIHPEHLVEPIAKLRLHPAELTEEHIGPFVPKFGKVNQDEDRRLESVAKIIAECTSIHAAATAVMQLEPWDLMAVYYDAVDHFSHGFMRYHPPRLPNVSEEDFEIYQEVLASGYRYHDMMLGTLLALVDDDTTVILMSDHGFHSDHRRPLSVPIEPAGPAYEHRDHGILVMKGPGIKKDEVIYGAGLLDITPTILHLFGLPVGEDMDGKVLLEAMENPGEVASIPTWDAVEGEDGGHPQDQGVHPLESREMIEQLVALGYIDQPDDNKEKAAADSQRELHYNLARAYMDAGRHLDAIDYLVQLVKEEPTEHRFGRHLVTCYQAVGRLEDARRVLEETIETKLKDMAVAQEELKAYLEEKEAEQKRAAEAGEEPKKPDEAEGRKLRKLRARASVNRTAFEELRGVQSLAEGDPEQALASFQNMAMMQGADAGAGSSVRMGQALLSLERWEEAESAFRQALEKDEERLDARLGLARACLGQRHNQEAAEAALEVVQGGFYNPEAHFVLGAALHRMGRVPKAVEALRVVVAQNPNHVKAHKRLARIYENRVQDAERAAEHRRLAEEAEANIERLKAGGVSARRAAFERNPVAPVPTLLDEHEELAAAPMSAPLAETVTIVSGMPRSGTSLMMQMLNAGGLAPLTDQERAADEHNEAGYYEDERVKGLSRDVSWLGEATGKALKVVAPLLMNLQRARLEHVRVVLMERPLEEVVASQGKMRAALDTSQKAPRMSDARLVEVYREQMQGVKRALAVARIPALSVSYPECISDPAGVAAKVNAFLGGGLDESAMTGVVRPELRHHVRDDEADEA